MVRNVLTRPLKNVQKVDIIVIIGQYLYGQTKHNMIRQRYLLKRQHPKFVIFY